MLFRTPTALLATVGFTAIVFVNNAYLVWAPNFLEEKFQLSLTEAGLELDVLPSPGGDGRRAGGRTPLGRDGRCAARSSACNCRPPRCSWPRR